MRVDLREYMSEEEQEQMDALVQRAMTRKARREETATGAQRFQFFKCECEGVMEAPAVDEEEQTGEEEISDLERLFRDICEFCLTHDLCQCDYHRERRERKRREFNEMLNSPLPF